MNCMSLTFNMLSSSTICLLSLNSMKVGFLLVFHILPRPIHRQDWLTGDMRAIRPRELLSLSIVI